MSKIIFFILCLMFTSELQAQTPIQQVNMALETLHKDKNYTQANISFTLIDQQSGKILYDKNKDIPLAPASTLKTFTTATALLVLGENFCFQTKVTFKGLIQKHTAIGELIIYGSGDPSLGSDRFNDTKPELIKKQISDGLKKLGIQQFKGKIRIDNSLFTDEAINTGWLDEDIGNYYGAGIYPLNWKENKFDIELTPTKNSFEVKSNSAGYNNNTNFCIELTHKDSTTTEEAFAFVEKNKACQYVIRGHLTNKEKSQSMQLARLHPDLDFKTELETYLKKELAFIPLDTSIQTKEINVTVLRSPPLSKLVYWCNQKSLNLYAEALCKTLAVKQFKQGNWTMGIASMVRYAKSKGINTSLIKLKDGCGLAPENKITTGILAQLLQLYTTEKFFPTFYESLPSINGLNMKSGYIGGTRSYAGYITLKDGHKACFAFIVHGYTCPPREVKLAMFRILDLLK
ncbi:MAG: D-alanyl-D-alanine carboxypeptidase/D-alanyl-D-alanine-endopeptidase [Chitinophagaceae bacterium]|nr:D-alanyl-D-alanine carboxypeptidase/D-alanyl-D-alanine-endopeptidase [Chitinophagaceae bacterium]